MSKERLDIWLKDKREQLKNATVFINENGNEAVEVSLSVLNKLFEQAERVQELESLEVQSRIEKHKYMDENKRYREAVEELIDSWKDNVKSTKQHNESDYSIYRVGLIEALQFAIDDLELALEEKI